MITLEATLRDVKVNPKHVRKSGNIPAVYYGPGKGSTAIAVSTVQFKKVHAEAGESSVITLKMPKESLDALIHDVTLDPVSGVPVHVDFYIVAKDRKVEVSVPLEFEGVAPAEKDGAVIMKIMHELLIEALPAKLPQHITVDLSVLAKVDDHIAVGDLELGEGVEALVPGTEVIALAAAPKEEKEEEVKPIDLTAIEVEKKGKTEEEEAAAE